MTAVEFAKLVKNPRRRSGSAWWDARCPAHDDRRSSLSFRDGDEGLVVECHARCSFEQIAAAVGRRPADFFHARDHDRRIVATYDYQNERGELLFQVVRFEPKDFRCRRPDGSGWAWNMTGVARIPYRLPELAERPRVYVVEGEKDADALAALGLAATTNEGGAGKWRPEHTAALVAAAVPEVVCIPDHDAPGEAHARAVAGACLAAGLRAKVLPLSDLPDKGDVSDWLASGGTHDQLEALADAAPMLTLGDLEPVPPVAPRATMTPEDGAWTWASGAGISFARVTEGSRGVSAEVVVTWQGRELHYGSLNLLSTRSREEVVRKVAVTAAEDVPWREYLDVACRQMVARVREGEPVEQLEARPRPREQYLVSPVLEVGESGVSFGPGGSGKGLYALLLELGVTTGCALPGGLRVARTCPVLVLDWESSRAAHEARLYELCRALGVIPPTTLYYKRMAGPLSESIRQIRADVARLGVGLVRVDSLALAAGREPEGADAATRTLNDLRTLGDHVTRHVIAHVAKSGLDIQAAGHVYGSVFNENIPRNVYEIRSTADPAEDELTLGVYHRKANERRRHAPFGLRFIFSPEDTPADARTIRVDACSLRETPDLAARTPLSEQLKAALSNGAKTIPALAVELDAKEDTIDKTLRRHRKTFVQLPDEKPPFAWGLKAR